ncbi:hypothetical protein CIHG_10312 [Coccidioides immitis H538.4]|uniref:Uncharacterized protein n=2 Tax=Coccidioides immitis TaxID=5501 RepID=A0A0J8R3L5_COCIT|nr:hypothetical protein CISG_07812 [Coccidioides immitis RMSCC 3703]KMU92500.1 hypothetical protein CIHG_10312 [Coccidioides immitis H538.4]TPX21010.1 hypothetical protein DIZ76_016910 [Coccidioides immitis]
MPSCWVLNDHFFSLEDVQLASLIPNIKDPELDALETPTQLTPKDYTVKVVRDYSAFLQRHMNARVQAFLSHVAQLSIGRTRSSDIRLSARLGRIYTLRKPTAVFNTLCKEEKVREWLQEQIESGSNVYLVIGLRTLFDTSTEEGARLAQHYAGQFSLPVEEFAAGMPIGNVGASGRYEQGREAANRYVAPGEQIFGIRVKKLTFKFFEAREVDRMRLARNSVWMMADRSRAASHKDSEIVEAGLEGEESEDQDEDNSAQEDNNTDFVIIESGK